MRAYYESNRRARRCRLDRSPSAIFFAGSRSSGSGGSQFNNFRIARCIPEVQNVDNPRVFVDGIDYPVLRSATDTEEVSTIRCTGQGEVRPGERRFTEIAEQNIAKSIDLLDREL